MVVCLRGALAAVTTTLAAGLAGAVPAADISPIELKALKARRVIQRGQVELESTYRKVYESGDERTWFDHRVVYFDGASIRNDQLKEYEPDRAKLHGKHYRSVSCFNGKEHISYSDEILPNGHTIALTLRPRESVDSKLHLGVDPRLIGMVPDTTANLVHHTLESVLGRPDRRETSVEEVALDGDRCKLVQYTRKDGLRARIWICPHKDFSVVKMQLEDTTSQPHYLDTISVSVSRHQPSGLWFPTGHTYTRFVRGKLTREQRAAIKVVSLNEPLPEDTFTLAGIGVPAGQRVHRVPEPPGARAEYWDGENIVPLEAEGTIPDQVYSTTRLVLAAVSVIGAIVVVIVSVRFRRRQAS